VSRDYTGSVQDFIKEFMENIEFQRKLESTFGSQVEETRLKAILEEPSWSTLKIVEPSATKT
jgi:hypothetical protein